MSSKSTFDQNLRRAAKQLPSEAVPASLADRAMSTLPFIAPQKNRRVFVTRLAVAGFAVAAVGAGLTLAPRTALISRSEAATMKEAIANARSWHFTGWRLVNGEKTRWEVWGQRSPFLYRETIGGEILLDDGTRRTHVLPPDKKNGRETGTVLVLPSQQAQTPRTGVAQTDGNGGYLLAGINGDSGIDCGQRAGGADYTCTSKQIYFGGPKETDEVTTLSVNGTTHLPTRYAVTRKEYAVPGDPGKGNFQREKRRLTGEYLLAELAPRYDVPLPKTLLNLDPPADYAVTDATIGASSATTDGGMTCTRKGVTLRAEIVGRDHEGNIHLRIKGWLGDQPIDTATAKLMLQINEDYENRGIRFDQLSKKFKINDLLADGAGNRYVWLNSPYNRVMTPDVWLAPLEPLVGAKTPRTLRLTVRADLSRYERMGNSGRTIAVVEDVFTFRVPLPEKTGALGWETAPDSPGMSFSGIKPTFLQEQAENRAEYYFGLGIDGSSTFTTNGRRTIPFADEREGWLRRAAYWHRVAAKEARKNKDPRNARRMEGNAINAVNHAENMATQSRR